MAVSKMNKLTLIAEQAKSEKVLAAIQGFQGIEVRDVFQLAENNQWVAEFFGELQPTVNLETVQGIDLQVEAIEKAIQFIQHNGSTKEKVPHLKRKVLSLQQLEAAFDEAELMAELQQIQQLEERFNQAEARVKELQEAENIYSKWQYLDIVPEEIKLQKLALILGTVDGQVWPDFKAALQQEPDIYFEEIYSEPKETNFSLLYLKETFPSIKNLMNQYSVQSFSYQENQLPKTKLQEIRKEQAVLYELQKKLAVEIGQKRIVVEKLEWGEEALLARKNRLLVQDRFIKTPQLFVLQGWVAQKEQTSFQQLLVTLLGDDEVYLSLEEATEGEINTEIPTKLDNHQLIQPFEMLTEMYALPKYKEIDPTPWFAPFYLVFFGMMVADIGYGLLMLVATTIALKTQVLPRGMMRFMKFFQILALPTMAWGVIYNSFFGFTMPYRPILSTSDDVISILIISVVFGLIQIFVGLGLAASENIKAKNYLGAISKGFAWQGIFIGIIVAAAGKMFLASQGLYYAGIVIAIISGLSIVIIPIFGAQSKIAALAGGAYDLYGITGYIGDLVSYTRLMALGISGGSIAAAFNMLVNYMPTGARFTVGIILMVALHGLNIFLSLLSAYVHGARLQYVEFFGKFYEGGGKPFAPLKTEEKYINIQQKEK